MRGDPSAPSSLNSRGSGVSSSLARRAVCIGGSIPLPCLALPPAALPHCATRRRPVWLGCRDMLRRRRRPRPPVLPRPTSEGESIPRQFRPDPATCRAIRRNDVATPPALRTATAGDARAVTHVTPRRHPLARVSGERSRCGPLRASVTDAEGGMAKASGRSRWAARVAGNRRGPRHAEAGLTPDGEVAVSRGIEENWRSGQSAGRNVRVT